MPLELVDSNASVVSSATGTGGTNGYAETPQSIMSVQAAKILTVSNAVAVVIPGTVGLDSGKDKMELLFRCQWEV